MSMIEELSESKMTNLLLANKINTKCFVYDVVDSTNTVAFNLLKDGSKYNDVIVIGKRQTAGKGTHGRVWEDNGGQLSLSIGFVEKVLPEILVNRRILTNRCIFDVLCKMFNKKFFLKDPNDILYQGKKLSGLLLESKMIGVFTNSWVIGYGLNVDGDENLWSDYVKNTATTLKKVVGKNIEINELCANILINIFATLKKK